MTGLVQGVWFRKYTQEQAQLLGLTGWVRNVPDGTVEIVATGEEKPLENFVAWCHQGPRGARVSNVALEETILQTFASFEIRRT